MKDVKLSVTIRVPDDTEPEDAGNELTSVIAENLDVSGTWFLVGHAEIQPLTADTGADSRMPAEIYGKPVISAFRQLPRYGSAAYAYIVIVSEGRQDDDGLNLYTVGLAEYLADAWVLGETRGGMPVSAAMREFAQMAYHAANAALRAAGGDHP